MKKMILASVMLVLSLAMQAQVRVFPKMNVGDKYVYDCVTNSQLPGQQKMTAKSTMEFYVSQKTADGYIVDVTMTEMTSNSDNDLTSMIMNMTEGMLKGVKIRVAVNAKGVAQRITNFSEIKQKCSTYFDSFINRLYTEHPQMANFMPKENLKAESMKTVTEEVLLHGITNTATNPLSLNGKTITEGMTDNYTSSVDIKMKRTYHVLGANKFSTHAVSNMSREDLKAFLIKKVGDSQPDKLEEFKNGLDVALESGALTLEATEDNVFELNANGWPKRIETKSIVNMAGAETTISAISTLR